MPIKYKQKVYTPSTSLLGGGTTAGIRFLLDSELANTTIILVTVDGTQYDLIYSGTVGNRQCKHRVSIGTLEFQNPFSSGAKIYVFFQE
jgi:hypothetical protein